MISTRRAVAAIVILLLAAVPTIVHTYMHWTVNDGWRASKVPVVLSGLTSSPQQHNSPTWGLRRFTTDDWIDRRYGADDGIRLTVVRTFDLKTVFHHPELAISYPESSLDSGKAWVTPDGDPVFVLRGIDQNRDLVIYALLANGAFVRNPYLHQVRLAAEMLVRGRQAMTLVYVQDRTPPSGPLEQQPALALLREAVASLRAESHGEASDPAVVR